MQRNSTKRRSSSNPVRISMIEREDKTLTRNDQRKTQTLKPKGIQTVEISHIPRPRFRSSSSDRAGSLGRKSYLKVTGRTPLQQPTTPITPLRISIKPMSSTVLTASSSRLHAPLSVGRSPSGDRSACSVGAKGPRKDTRPLIDKTYQMVLLNKIDGFFCMNQCSTMLNSNGSLKPITLKMFVEVSGFLLKYFDIKHDLTMANYIDELPKYAKKLHYPGIMTKSWLKTANAMHSWPYVLGWIGWLVEACQVRDLAFNRYQLENLPFIGMEQQAQSYNMEFQALLKLYKAWNDEKLDEETEILEQYLQNIKVQQGVTDDVIAQADKELEEQEMKFKMHEEESRKLDEKLEHLQQKIASLSAKESKQLSHNKTLEDYINKASTNIKQLNSEHEVLNEQIRMGHIEYEKLVSIVKNQSMSKTEKEDILKNCTEIHNYIHQFDEHLNDYRKESFSLDLQFSASNNNLNKAILTYNKEVFMLIDNDIERSLDFDELKVPEQRLLEPEIMDIMEEKASLIKTFKETLMKQCNEVESLIRSDTIELEKLQEKIKSLPDENKLNEEIAYISGMKADAKKENKKLVKQIKDLRNGIKEMQDMIPNIADLAIEEAQDKLDAVIRRKTFLEQSAKRFFEDFYKIIGDHRRELNKILTKDRTK